MAQQQSTLMKAWNGLARSFASGLKLRVRVLDHEAREAKDLTIGFLEHDLAAKLLEGNDGAFCFDGQSIIVNPEHAPMNYHQVYIEACNQAFLDVCEKNQNEPLFKDGMAIWFEKRGIATPQELYYPVFSPYKELQGLHVPTPARGIFGVPTAGAHLNVYDEDDEGKIQHIWVSVRSDKTTYPCCYDQIVAGGMGDMDDLDPWQTIRREAREEANLDIDVVTGTVTKDVRGDRIDIGKIEQVRSIHFVTKKDERSRTEDGHVEPGVRFCFDLKVGRDAATHPLEHNPDEVTIKRFERKTVDEVKESLRQSLSRTRWKPNCGLVMLDFLERKGLLSDEDRSLFGNVEELQARLPLELPFQS